MADQFEMTQKGYDEAVERLKYLQTTKRAEIVSRIAEARSHGDLSENAEYDAARNEQAANEGEISELDYKLKHAKIIEESNDSSVVRLGFKVTVCEVENGVEGEAEVYTIRGTTEVNVTEDDIVISNESPVGSSLIGHKKGETVEISAPNGKYFLKILKIEKA